jgi:hypothetical protein
MVGMSFTDRYAPPRTRAGPTIPAGVRGALCSWLRDHGVTEADVWRVLAQSRGYQNPEDVFEEILDRWGEDEASVFGKAVVADRHEARNLFRVDPELDMVARPILQNIPAPLFLDSLEHAIELLNTKHFQVDDDVYDTHGVAAIEQINRLFEKRGIYYRFTPEGKAEWHGDPEAYEQLVAPALGALDDPRLATAAQEFRDSLASLRGGDRIGDKNATRDASNAVESAMKALLDAHGVPRRGNETAVPLWEALRDAGIVAEKSREPVCSAPQLGNMYGRHGPEPDPEPLPDGIPTLTVHSATSALVYLAGLLPDVAQTAI